MYDSGIVVVVVVPTLVIIVATLLCYVLCTLTATFVLRHFLQAWPPTGARYLSAARVRFTRCAALPQCLGHGHARLYAASSGCIDHYGALAVA